MKMRQPCPGQHVGRKKAGIRGFGKLLSMPRCEGRPGTTLYIFKNQWEVLCEHLYAMLGALQCSSQVSGRMAVDKRFEQPANAPQLLSKYDMSLLQTRSKMQKDPRDRRYSPFTPRAPWRTCRSTGHFDPSRTDKGGKGKGKGYNQRFVPRKEKVDDRTTQWADI